MVPPRDAAFLMADIKHTKIWEVEYAPKGQELAAAGDALWHYHILTKVQPFAGCVEN